MKFRKRKGKHYCSRTYEVAIKELKEATRRYKVIRYYYSNDRKQTIIKECSLGVAQLHCRDPLTRKEGKWFDGYIELKKGG